MCNEGLREIQQVHLAAADHPVVPVAEPPARDRAARDGEGTDSVTTGVKGVAHATLKSSSSPSPSHSQTMMPDLASSQYWPLSAMKCSAPQLRHMRFAA